MLLMVEGMVAMACGFKEVMFLQGHTGTGARADRGAGSLRPSQVTRHKPQATSDRSHATSHKSQVRGSPLTAS